MSLKCNILASYVSQIYVTLIGIIMLPMYIRYMGTEAYGLVGFFAMLQAWFQLLDMGLTPTMARATASFNGGASDALSLRRLLRSLEGIFICVAIIGAIAIIIGSDFIAKDWLKVQELPLEDVRYAIILMGFIVALRWVCGLYRGAINGFERLVWLSGFNIAVSTARFVLVIPVFIYVGSSPKEFFVYQLFLAIIETALLVIKTYTLLPQIASNTKIAWNWEPLRDVLKFSLSIAFTSSIWIIVTQTDKLVLSKLLPLTEYAYLTLAVLVAGGVTVISGPISSALLPRITKLAAQKDEAAVVALYRNATQLVAVIAIPTALTLAFFSKQLLLAWTGDINIANKAAPMLTLYALGNGVLALAAFPYYLQYAKGDLKLHLIGNVLFVILLIPALTWATLEFGAVGAGYAWLISNVIYFVFWIPKVHSRFVAGLHYKWVFADIGGIALCTIIAILPIYAVLNWPQGRGQIALIIVLISFGLIGIASASSSFIRSMLISKWRTSY